MPASRLLQAVVAVLLVLLVGAAPTAGADTGTEQEAPAPVQVLSLTTAEGEATDVAEAGLDEAQGEAQEEQQPADGTGQPSSVTPVVGATREAQEVEVVPAAETEAATPEADAVLLTEPLEVSDFLVAGFTWAEGTSLPEGTQIYLRVREGSEWSEWYLNESVDSGPDDVAAGGTGEFVTGGADAVQAAVLGAPEDLPADLQLALVPGNPEGEQVLEDSDVDTAEAGPTPVSPQSPEPGETGTEEQESQDGGSGEGSGESGGAESTPASPEVSQQPAVGPSDPVGSSVLPAALGAATTANGLPVEVTTRAEWGANSAYMTWSPSYASASHVVVHHTAGTNSYTSSQSASIVNGIYYYHAVTLGWGDIGYNFLIDKYGRVFEGRYGSTTAAAGKMVVGGHALGVNTGTMGLSMLGTYSSVAPTDTQVQAVGKMAGWFLGRAGVSSATGSANLTIRTTARYQAGTTVSLPRIIGHRDVGYTTCPGDVGYSRLGTIRSVAQGVIGSTVGSINTIYLNNSWSARADIELQYGRSTSQMLSGDWNGDGVDTLARRDGNKVGFRNTNSTGGSLRTFTYGRASDEVLVGDWDGNGTDTLAVRRGNTYYFRNSMDGGQADVTTSYGRADDEVVVGDWNGDGRDTLAVRRGSTYYIKNSISAGAADRVVPYGRSSDTVLSGDWDGDGRDTLAVRRGNTYYVKNTIAGGAADITQAYGRAADKVLVGDWDGDRDDTLGVVR
ncbi:N-acetylmuramoyl-L-alanine amidase [Actinomyces wuliandei]|uniref:N-acetylmuramoyl-L-alanine amidase n=1 Tax=Actinomyces wuliandei TaxID=2057743 RepID=UPI000FDB0CC6|nr:N-acetylmuramoyl-L-alanine amidase [Actinomyces wuliandei]